MKMEEIISENVVCDVEEISESIGPLPEIEDVDAIENLLKQQDCTHMTSDDNELLSAWTELRTSLRQLHRTVIPSPQSNKWQNPLKGKPSISRIKQLSNMLLNHDSHQLFTKLSQLSQELCIELKVRLLNTVTDSPTEEDSKAFIHGMCESYQWVMTICEVSQTALEKLDSDHLSLFGLNWTSVNMHAFYTTVFTDPDVQDYLAACSAKLLDLPDNETLECLTSLQRTLIVAEELWSRAEINLHRYAQQINPMKRADEGGCTHENCNSVDVKSAAANSTEVAADTSVVQCPCRSCMSEVDSKAANATHTGAVEGYKNLATKGCDCHFCQASNLRVADDGKPIQSVPKLRCAEISCCKWPAYAFPTIENYRKAPEMSDSPLAALGGTCGGSLPPISQPQLNLYPHIHGKPTDLVNAQPLDDLLRSPVSSSKPPPIPSHLLGSDVLTQQLLREWEMAYGDAISPPASRAFNAAAGPLYSKTDPLVNGLQNLSLHQQEQMPGSSMYMMNNVSSVIPNSLLTTTVSSKQTSSTTTTSCGFAHISTLNGSEGAGVRDLDHRAMNGNAGVITHTKYSMASNPECDHRGCHQRSDDNCTTGESSSMGDSSGGDVEGGMSSEDYEPYTSEDSSEEHAENHCDCCYCRLLEGQQGGGRQRYNDRRERLLKILARKKATVSSSSSSDTSNAPVPTSTHGTQDINQIMNYIEGRRESRDKKPVVKKPRKKKENYKKLEARARALRPKKKSTSNDEDEDGPLAELRRGAPDVTVTVVKPGDRPPHIDKIPARSQISISRNPENAPHPLMVLPQQNAPESWVPPTSRIGANLAAMGFQGDTKYGMGKSAPSLLAQNTGRPQGSSINNLLKNMQPGNRKSNADKDGSQMVTIKRVMDPVTADPTVTITLKGAEKKKDEVLAHLIDGQMPGGKGPKEDNRPYDIPKGLTDEEAKRYKTKLRKERRKQKKIDERLLEEREDQMQQLHIQKQQQLLRQQEKEIKQQQVALQRQQEELVRQQQQKICMTAKGVGKKSAQLKKNKNINSKTDAKLRRQVDMSKNYTLPPGVSINKVAGQPGMVTISNNLGGPQPFLSNPNVFANSFGGSCGASAAAPFPSASMSTPYPYGTSWNDANSRKENVIVVDTKTANSSNKKGPKNNPLTKKDTKANPSKKDTKTNPSKKDTKANVPKKDTKANVPKKDTKVNVPKKDTKANVPKKDTKANVPKKDTKANVPKKDTKVNVPKKDTIVNVPKKDTKTNIPNKKDVKVKVNPLKDMKNNLAKKDVKANTSKTDAKSRLPPLKTEVRKTPLKKDARGNLPNKDGKSKTANKKEAQRPKAPPKKTLEDMTPEEQFSAALKGDVDLALLSKIQRKKVKWRLATLEREAAEQREEDELMDKMYNISLGNTPVVKAKAPSKKVKQAVEIVTKKPAKGGQSGATVERLQKQPASQPPKQEVPKARSKTENVKSQPKRCEEPKKYPSRDATSSRKPEVDRQTFRNASKVNTKQPMQPAPSTRKQAASAPTNNAARHTVDRQDFNRGAAHTSKKSIPTRTTYRREEEPIKKQKGKASKKNSLDDMAIDNIFTPNSNDANLDEADREVEAFKRFCFENPKGNAREKLKINFNVKDIVITKKYGLY